MLDTLRYLGVLLLAFLLFQGYAFVHGALTTKGLFVKDAAAQTPAGNYTYLVFDPIEPAAGR